MKRGDFEKGKLVLKPLSKFTTHPKGPKITQTYIYGTYWRSVLINNLILNKHGIQKKSMKNGLIWIIPNLLGGGLTCEFRQSLNVSEDTTLFKKKEFLNFMQRTYGHIRE